ncbi:DUF7683 domain-containing protein [Pseudomonas alliivorans]
MKTLYFWPDNLAQAKAAGPKSIETMKYLLEAFDKKTEFLAFEKEIPAGNDERLKSIMGWTSEQWGDEGYNLDAAQLAAIVKLIGDETHDPNYFYQLTCNADDL